MAALLSTSPSTMATLPGGFRPTSLMSLRSNVPTIRVSLVSGLRLHQKAQFTKAIERASTLSRLFHTPISCSAAQPETLQTVQSTIAKQLSIDESTVTPETKFSDLGADSLDTVEIMMALEEKFGVSVGEEGAENISTVQDAADLIEKVKGGES